MGTYIVVPATVAAGRTAVCFGHHKDTSCLCTARARASLEWQATLQGALHYWQAIEMLTQHMTQLYAQTCALHVLHQSDSVLQHGSCGQILQGLLMLDAV